MQNATTDDDARWVAGSIERETESRGRGDCFLEINLPTQTSTTYIISDTSIEHRGYGAGHRKRHAP
jgi:hypothetical protein